MPLIAEADFGLSLLRETSINQTTVLSPISVALALSMVHLGAKGNTKEQIKNVLCKNVSHDACTSHFASIQHSLTERWRYCMIPENKAHNDCSYEFTIVHTNIANRMFSSNDFAIKESYQKDIASRFRASLQNLDYKNIDEAVKTVNDFVKSETSGQIDNLVKADSFSDDQSGLLVNAIYFHGSWHNDFFYLLPKKENFYLKDGMSKKIFFMKQRKEFKYVVTKEFTAVSLAYSTKYEYRFTIVLPNERFGLADALKKLKGEDLQKLITSAESRTVDLTIPKFKIETETDLRNVLKKIGITDAFEETADLSGITDGFMQVGKVTHKVVIDVNERGTTAAAATAVHFQLRSFKRPDPNPVHFVADHPFLFVLSFKGHILFTGQYYG